MSVSEFIDLYPHSTFFLVSAVIGILSIGTLLWAAIVFYIRLRRSGDERW